jgi:hypothetical protein
MPDDFAIVTAYTHGPQGGGYETEVAGWIGSVMAFLPGHPVYVHPIGEVDNWRDAAHAKPAAIAVARKVWGNVLWIDVDARIVEPVVLPPDAWTCDVAVRIWHSTVESGIVHHMTGTCCVPAGSRVFDEWARRSVGSRLPRNQRVLEEILQGPGASYSVCKLPPELCWLAWGDRDAKSYPGRRPVIEHAMRSKMQGARRHTSASAEPIVPS